MSKPVILITGALTGIGRATALTFARNGARLAVSGRRQAEGKALEAELRQLGAEVAFIRADVRHDNEVRDLVDQTVARFGRLDAAVNNAGTEGQPGLVVNQTAESYAATFDTNVLGTLLSLKHELRVMTAQKSGSIINISSTYGHEGAAYASVYAGSKLAVSRYKMGSPVSNKAEPHESAQGKRPTFYRTSLQLPPLQFFAPGARNFG